MLIITFFLFLINIFSLPLLAAQKNISINHIRYLDRSTDTNNKINNTNKFIIIGESKYSHISNAIDEEGQLFLISGKSSVNYRYIYALMSNGRYYYKNSSIHKYYLSNSIIALQVNSIIINSNNKKYLLNIIYGNCYFEVLGLSSENLDNNIYKMFINIAG